MDDLDITIDFTDVTLSQTNGIYSEVKKIMESEFPYPKNWVIKTDITIDSEFGMGEMTLNFYFDGRIYIINYIPSVGDVFYNPDLQVISQWSQENGWKIPQPSEDLIKDNKEFWKHFYDTLIIDSDYFDEKYGKRPQIEQEDEK